MRIWIVDYTAKVTFSQICTATIASVFATVQSEEIIVATISIEKVASKQGTRYKARVREARNGKRLFEKSKTFGNVLTQTRSDSYPLFSAAVRSVTG